MTSWEYYSFNQEKCMNSPSFLKGVLSFNLPTDWFAFMTANDLDRGMKKPANDLSWDWVIQIYDLAVFPQDLIKIQWAWVHTSKSWTGKATI